MNMHVDRTVLRETGYVALWSALFSVLMEACFLVMGKWSLPVLWGNLAGCAVSILNFFLMGLTVQQAVQMEEQKAALRVKLSQGLRLLMLFAFGVLFVQLSVFHWVAALIPYFFPRIACALRPLMKGRKKNGPVLPGQQKGDEQAT